jgi:thiamine-monophosphate kinase
MEFSENDLLKRIRRFGLKGKEVLRGIGDDCAVIDLNAGPHVFTQDALVEHVHFEFSFVDPYSLGKKALYVNISDVLSMGALPLYFLVTLAIPRTIEYRTIDAFYRGLSRAAREFHAGLIGGDVTATTGPLVIDISMIGRLEAKRYLGRNGARKGDLIGVTGLLGESAYGLKLLKECRKGRGDGPFLERYRRPRPPLAEWQELVKRDIPNSMMDVSDGLLMDLERMMQESGRRARIDVEHVPVPRRLRQAGLTYLALSGGEDYQLLFTFSPEKEGLIGKLRSQGYGFSVIGEVGAGSGVEVFDQGMPVKPPVKGYDHFGEQP